MQGVEEPFRSTQNRNEILIKEERQTERVERAERAERVERPCDSNREENTSCKQHIGESAILYCFTCEGGCFCMECYLQGLHKNHEVKNVQKSLKQLKEIKVDSLWYSIKQSQENLLNDQCKLTNKKRELVELGASAKLQIQQNFEQLYRILEQKEKELVAATDEMVQEKMKELDEQMDNVKKLNDVTRV